MKTLYSLYDAEKRISKNKQQKRIILFMFLLTMLVVFLLTYFFMSLWVIFVDIVLTSFCLCYWFTYTFYYRKENINQYHFLAKIQHYPHERLVDVIDQIDEQEITIEGIVTHTVSLKKGRKIQIEDAFTAQIEPHKKYQFDVVDHFIVGYEEVLENE